MNNIYKKINEKLKEIQLIRQEFSLDPSNLNLKKRFYQKKIEIIDLIKQEKQGKAITAKDLFKKGIPVIKKHVTGINSFDRLLGGIPENCFIQIAGASGSGKTSLSLKIMAKLAQNMKIVHFDFEMGEIKLALKLKKLLTSNIQQENYIIDFSSYDLDDLISEIEIYSKEGIKFFLIDSKMKIEVKGIYSAYDSSRIISKELQRLTRENNITIILINQLSETAIREGIATLKGGNDQKYDSDIILMLYKYYPASQENDERKKLNLPPKPDNTKRQLFVAKNRLGKDEIHTDILIKEIEFPPTAVKEITPELKDEEDELKETKNSYYYTPEIDEALQSALAKEKEKIPF